jgi:hypothetical protein
VYNLALLLLLLTASTTIMKAQNFNYLQKVVEPSRHWFYSQSNFFGSSISIDGNFAVVGADMLDIDNSNIMVSAIHEDNEKKVNEVYLNTIAKGNYDYNASHLSVLEQVASQCPWEGGNAVFRARGMLALVQRVIINDESMCEAKSLPEDYNQGEKTVIEDIFVENDYLKLYPNPAQNYISIELQSEIDAKIESVEIFNLNGQKLKSYLNTSAKELLQIELESLSEGMYICRVIMSDNSIQTLKFSVIK